LFEVTTDLYHSHVGSVVSYYIVNICLF